ncbi:MAG: hypothetical protein WDN24_14530 [Sphingomonas sp.]
MHRSTASSTGSRHDPRPALTQRQTRIALDLLTGAVVVSVAFALAGLSWRIAGHAGTGAVPMPPGKPAGAGADIAPTLALAPLRQDGGRRRAAAHRAAAPAPRDHRPPIPPASRPPSSPPAASPRRPFRSARASAARRCRRSCATG